MGRIDDLFSAFEKGKLKQKPKVKTHVSPLGEAARKKRESETYIDGVTYIGLKKDVKENADKVSKLRGKLLERVLADGVNVDENHRELRLGQMQFVITFREGGGLDTDAAEVLLKKKGLYAQATVPVIDPDKVMDLYRAKKLTQEEIKSITNITRTPALDVSMREEKKGRSDEDAEE